MNLKNKLDFQSIRFKLWFYFIFFAVAIVSLIWILQIVFLNMYYEQMKVGEVTKLANEITASFNSSTNMTDFTDHIDSISHAYEDTYVRIESAGAILYSPEYSGSGSRLYRYGIEIQMLDDKLRESPLGKVAVILNSSGSESETRMLGYACYLNRSEVTSSVPVFTLYVFSPLYPVKSTIAILRNQLVYITVIAIILAFLIALFLSTRISRPIKNITNSAAQMGKGNYGIQFQGGKYTEIKDLAETLTDASRELEKTDMYQKDLIANVSHDLRTPLTMIKSYAEMIRDLSGDNPAKREAHLAVIIDETDRLNALVTDMLNMSRMQNRSITLEKDVFDLSATVRGLMPSYDIYSESEDYNIKLVCPGSFYVNADEAKIKQVLSNLINNAIKYCGEDKVIIVKMRKVAKRVRVEVIDHGKGIAPDEISHVWERYYKSSTHHVRTTEGSGLGLSIVKEILSMHRAEYGVNSKVGKGSVFWFELDTVKKKK